MAEREAATAALPPGARERIDAMSGLVKAAAPAVDFEASANVSGEVVLTVDRRIRIAVAAQAMNADPNFSFDHLRFISGVDQMDEGIEIVYALWSYSKRHALFVKTLLPHSGLRVDSVTSHLGGGGLA